jgi:hypothetical protein
VCSKPTADSRLIGMLVFATNVGMFGPSAVGFRSASVGMCGYDRLARAPWVSRAASRIWSEGRGPVHTLGSTPLGTMRRARLERCLSGHSRGGRGTGDVSTCARHRTHPPRRPRALGGHSAVGNRFEAYE